LIDNGTLFIAGPSCKIPNITRRPLSQSDINRFIEQVITNSDNTLTASGSQSQADNTRSCNLSQPVAVDEASCCKLESNAEVYSNKSEDITTLVEVASVISERLLHEKSLNNGSAVRHIDDEPCSRDGLENLSAMENFHVLCNAVETDVPYVADEVEMCTTDDNIVPIRNPFLEGSPQLLTCAVSPEINNNHQLIPASVANVEARSVMVKSVTSKCGLRKSKRCNRGQRYQELVSNGTLHHTRKRLAHVMVFVLAAVLSVGGNCYISLHCVHAPASLRH
jgi:hypothetical protein